jgi:endonuclease/exonuclease/phosphatase family metal-dependent hydrolase
MSSFKIPLRVIPWLCLLTGALLGQDAKEPGFTVMSFNCWYQWSRVDDGFAKAAAAIRASGADIAGLQESSPEAAKRMAAELGWQHAAGGTGSVQIVSRHPIVEVLHGEGIGRDRFIGARIRLAGSPAREVVLFNTHLDYQHYGPYEARKAGATAESVLALNRKSERVAQIAAVVASMKPQLVTADETPVLLTGDFNVPSHLDWTAATAGQHGGVGPVEWPESLRLAQDGLVDSFRLKHPDPAAEPGSTWSPIHKAGEPQDRIDFIYHKGSGLRVIGSRTFTTAVETTIGAWGGNTAPVAGNTWPSDHAAVLTSYAFLPATLTEPVPR